MTRPRAPRSFCTARDSNANWRFRPHHPENIVPQRNKRQSPTTVMARLMLGMQCSLTGLATRRLVKLARRFLLIFGATRHRRRYSHRRIVGVEPLGAEHFAFFVV